MKCTKCGDEIAFESDRRYWLGEKTGGECPAADVTLEELSGDLDVLLNGHTPEPEPEPVKPPHPDDTPVDRRRQHMDCYSGGAECLVGSPTCPMAPEAPKPEPATPSGTENERSERTWTCDEENCLHPVRDFVRLALQSATGSMVIEVRLCDMHLATVEISNSGTYMYVRTRAH